MILFGGGAKKKNIHTLKEIRSLIRHKKYDAALVMGRKYLRQDPGNHDVLFVVGGILYMKKRYVAAISCFEQVLQISRYDPDVLALKAECHHELGQESKARQCWQDILEVDPKNAQARQMLG